MGMAADSPFPSFLGDIGDNEVVGTKKLLFASTAPPAKHTIDGHQFDGEVGEVVLLNTVEEWKVSNATANPNISHPFHIHINPFQIVEWFDPTLPMPSSGVKMAKPWVWWDNFAIPPGGWVKMLTRFVDYTGTYVFHCHILGHEDRGMMEMVNVSPSGTSMKHK